MIELSLSDTIVLGVILAAILYLIYDNAKRLKIHSDNNVDTRYDDSVEIPVSSNAIKFSVVDQLELEEQAGWDGIMYQSTLVSPFSVHLANHMSSKPVSLDQLDKINHNFLGALEGLASEIEVKLEVPSSVKAEVLTEESEDGLFLVGSIRFDLDKYHPSLYSISICLFLDGFLYNASSNTYTLKSKISLL